MNIPKNPTAVQLLRILPFDKLNDIATDCKADYKAKKLSAMRMMCMMTCAFLETTRLSQRFIGREWANHSFASLFGLSLQDGKVEHSSISHRLDTMPVKFFEDSYSLVADIGESVTSAEDRARHSLVRVDSSMVQDVLGKLKKGITCGRKSGVGYSDRKQLKYTVAFDGFRAISAKIFTDPKYTSEDVAIPEVVLSSIASSKYHNEIYLFDRGVSSTKELGNIDDATKGKHDTFVGRLKLSRVILNEKPYKTDEEKTDGYVEIISDSIGSLRLKSGKTDTHKYRFIRLKINKDRTPTRTAKGKRRVYDDEILLITNDMNSTALEICEYYRHRWDIEVFYKFLKQNLSMAHLISSSENGLNIIMYMMLIVATLVMIFEKLNSLGPSEAIQTMRIQLMNWVFDHPANQQEATENSRLNAAEKPTKSSFDH